jgi:hypothetical protein
LKELVVYKGVQCVYVRGQREPYPECLILPGGKRVNVRDVKPGDAIWPETFRWEPPPVARVADDVVDPRQMDLLEALQ